MSQKTTILVMILLLGPTLCTCNKSDETIVNPPIISNLIANSSFESGDNFSLQGWNIVLNGGSMDSARDAAPGGGAWSLVIHDAGGIPPVAQARFTVSAPPGTHIYQFSLWAKYTRDAGIADFSIKRPDTLYDLRSIRISDTLWTLYGSIDTLSTNAGDSLRVTLAGGFGVVRAKTFFDLCRLEVLN